VIAMPERLRVLLFLNGLGLIAAAMLSGWLWSFQLLGRMVLWPIPRLANDVLYVIGWPPMIGVHVMIVLSLVGVVRYLRETRALSS
jgi:hypothetical protein